MTKRDCIIDVGTVFTVEWYFDEKGYSQGYEYFLQTSNDQKRKFLLLVKKMVEFGKILDITKYRNEGDGIYAFKPQPDRYLSFFIKGKKIIITNAFYKNTDKLPKSEKERALSHMASYQKRNQEGTYYVD
jgi:hypothetical protein